MLFHDYEHMESKHYVQHEGSLSKILIMNFKKELQNLFE